MHEEMEINTGMSIKKKTTGMSGMQICIFMYSTETEIQKANQKP